MLNPLEKYNKIIGSGGFGLVLKHEEQDQVIKLLYSGGCKQAYHEYEKNKDVYDAFGRIKNDKYLAIVIPKPLIFNMENVVKDNVKYSCFYIMSYLHPIRDEKILYHVINNQYKPLFNKKVGRVYSLPISDKNPPRGFFATYDYIRDNILSKLNPEYKGDLNTIENIIRYMGYAFGTIIFVGGYKPVDVEYVLCENDNKLALGVLDFGMIEPIDWSIPTDILVNIIIDDIIDIDLYFPTPGSPEMKWFIDGLQESFKSMESEGKTDFYKALIYKLSE